MKWKDIPPKERGLIKGALRRVFSRSELRRRVLATYSIDHQDVNRIRVSAWVWCGHCGVVFPRYLAVVDHISPLMPIGTDLIDMEPTQIVEGLWCAENNLQVLDEACHKLKNKLESRARKEFRKGRKNG